MRSSSTGGVSGARGLPRQAARIAGVALAFGTMLVALALVLRDEPGPDGTALGGGRLELLGPCGSVDDPFTSFCWRAEAPADSTYRVRVWELAQGSPEQALERSGVLHGPPWQLPPERAALLPDAIGWDVSAYGPGGQPLGSARGSARRAP